MCRRRWGGGGCSRRGSGRGNGRSYCKRLGLDSAKLAAADVDRSVGAQNGVASLAVSAADAVTIRVINGEDVGAVSEAEGFLH